MIAPLTCVTLVSVEPWINVYLRFGAPAHWRRQNGGGRDAFFAPGSVFCRVWWEGNSYGTTLWQLSIMRAGAPGEAIQAIRGVQPGSVLLLHARSGRTVRRVLDLIKAIEAQKIALEDVAPTYWRAVHNRLAGRSRIGPYGRERHAAELARATLR